MLPPTGGGASPFLLAQVDTGPAHRPLHLEPSCSDEDGLTLIITYYILGGGGVGSL